MRGYIVLKPTVLPVHSHQLDTADTAENSVASRQLSLVRQNRRLPESEKCRWGWTPLASLRPVTKKVWRLPLCATPNMLLSSQPLATPVARKMASGPVYKQDTSGVKGMRTEADAPSLPERYAHIG